MLTFTFSPPELAVLVERMTGDALPLDGTAVDDLHTDAAALTAAEDALRDRGLLLSAPFVDDAAVRSDLATVLATTFAPDLLCVLRTTDRSGRVEREHFSFTSECVASNRVDQAGRHHFAEFVNSDEAIQTMTESADGAAATGTQSEPLEGLIRDSELMALLLVVARPAAPDAESRALAWLRAHDGLWLVDADTNASARPISSADLRQELVRTLGPMGGAA